MELLKGRINWNSDFDNTPKLELLIKDIPSFDKMVFQQKGSLYFAEQDGFCRYFFYDKRGEGYGGSSFVIKMDTGEEKTLVGPWSSRSAVINENDAGFPHLIDCCWTKETETWKRGHTFCAGAFTVEWINQNTEKIEIGNAYEGRNWVNNNLITNNIIFQEDYKCELAIKEYTDYNEYVYMPIIVDKKRNLIFAKLSKNTKLRRIE